MEIAAHKSKTAKGSLPVTSCESHFILTKTGKHVDVGLRKYMTSHHYMSNKSIILALVFIFNVGIDFKHIFCSYFHHY